MYSFSFAGCLNFFLFESQVLSIAFIILLIFISIKLNISLKLFHKNICYAAYWKRLV